MSGKRPANIMITCAPKKSRKSVNLKVKLEVLRRYDAGERPSEIARLLHLPDSTVRTIKINEKKILECAQSVTPLSASRINKSRDKVMDNMERLLDVWIEDQARKHVPLSLVMIQQKAKSLFTALKIQYGDSSTVQTFTASRGWFQRFKRRSSLHNIKMSGDVTSVDSVTANQYSIHLKTTTEESGHTRHQDFNVDETGLYWKWMPSRSYIAKEEKTVSDFKVAKDDCGFEKAVPEVPALVKDDQDDGDNQQAGSEDLSIDKSVQTNQKWAAEDNGTETEETIPYPSKHLTTKHLSDLFSLLKEANEIVVENDPNMERSCAFTRGLENLTHCYKELYKHKKAKGTSLLTFSKATDSTSTAVKNILPLKCNKGIGK